MIDRLTFENAVDMLTAKLQGITAGGILYTDFGDILFESMPQSECKVYTYSDYPITSYTKYFHHQKFNYYIQIPEKYLKSNILEFICSLQLARCMFMSVSASSIPDNIIVGFAMNFNDIRYFERTSKKIMNYIVKHNLRLSFGRAKKELVWIYEKRLSKIESVYNRCIDIGRTKYYKSDISNKVPEGVLESVYLDIAFLCMSKADVKLIEKDAETRIKDAVTRSYSQMDILRAIFKVC